MDYDMDFEMYSLCVKLDALHIGYEHDKPSKHRIRKHLGTYRYVGMIPPFYSEASFPYIKRMYTPPLFRSKQVQEPKLYLPNHIIEKCVDASPMRTFKNDIFSGWKNTPTSFPVSAITNVSFARWAIDKGLPRNPHVATIVAGEGHADVLKLLYEEGFPIEWPDCLLNALMKGQMHLAHWLADIELSRSVDEEDYKDKMIFLWLDLPYHSPNVVPALNWIKNSGHYIDVWGITVCALGSFNIPSLQWLHSNLDTNLNDYPFFLNKLFEEKALDLIVWLYDLGWLPETDLLTKAMEHGRIDVIRWATLKGLNVN